MAADIGGSVAGAIAHELIAGMRRNLGYQPSKSRLAQLRNVNRPQSPMEGDEWRLRCYEIMERLIKAKEPPPEPSTEVQEEPFFGEKNLLILQKCVQNGSVDAFVDMLEHVCSEEKLHVSAVFNQVTRAGDSLLHEAAYFERLNIADLIGHHFPELLTKTNNKGDTPLHVAARASNSAVIKVILDAYEYAQAHKSTSSENEHIKLTRLVNDYLNTPLHEAVRSNNFEGAKLLFKPDECVAHYLNKSSKSPLYLAIKHRHNHIVQFLLEASFPNDKPLQKCYGNSPLHAAISTQNAVLIKEILEKRSNLMYLRDEEGGIPLHYAAYRGYAEGVCKLLDKSASSALEWNAKGQLPIHLACKEGHLKVVHQFLKQKWVDDPRVLVNRKCQNILHVAAKNGRDNVVKYILRSTKLDVNEKDKKGNTALHLASKSRFPSILWTLTRDKRTKPNKKNNDGFTAYDIVLMQYELETPETAEGQMLSAVALTSVGAHQSDNVGKYLSSWTLNPKKLEWVNNSCNSMMIVAVLIATVTFAAGFTVPGGVYGPDDPNPHKRGVAVLGKKWIFQIFVIFNTLAMYSSSIGCFLVLTAQYSEVHLAMRYFMIGYHMVGGSLLAMFLSFLAAVHLVVTNISLPALLIITVVGIISFSFLLGFFMLSVYPLIYPLLLRSSCSRLPLLRQLLDLPIGISIWMYGRPLYKVKANKKLERSVSSHCGGQDMKGKGPVT